MVLAGPPVALNELYIFHFYMMEFLRQSYIAVLECDSQLSWVLPTLLSGGIPPLVNCPVTRLALVPSLPQCCQRQPALYTSEQSGWLLTPLEVLPPPHTHTYALCW